MAVATTAVGSREAAGLGFWCFGTILVLAALAANFETKIHEWGLGLRLARILDWLGLSCIEPTRPEALGILKLGLRKTRGRYGFFGGRPEFMMESVFSSSRRNRSIVSAWLSETNLGTRNLLFRCNPELG